MAGKSSIEVDGVEVEYDAAKLADVRFVLMLGDLEDDSLGVADKMVVQSRMLRFVFGDQRDKVMDAIAEDGALTQDLFRAWWIDFLKAANAKN